MLRDSRWLIIFVILTAVITTTVVLNINHDLDTATRLENSLNVDNGDLDINWDKYPTTNITLATSIELTSPGTYHLTGTITDGSISVKLDPDYPIKLILDNVSISNSTGPAIACYSGDDLVIELVGENVLSDGTTYSSVYDEDVTGAIYSKADLTFTGDGSLNLTANYQDGIVSKDDLTFRSGTYQIITADDAIRGKDSVHITSGNFTLSSTADAIKSTNETDPGKGFVLIENGNFNLTASAKGLKSTNDIVIKDGNYSLQTTDDAIHSNNYVDIAGGTLNLSSGDDAIHADRELVINGGNLNITKSYEGLEAQVITINDGTISIIASDDGINAGGGTNATTTTNRAQDPFNADENCVLSVNGGNLYVNASGDGVDSNGWLYFNGGTTIIDGPTNDGNGALDAGMGIIMNGGEVIALGSSGMAESPSQTSSINSVSIFLEATYPAGTLVEIQDQFGTTVASHSSAKSFSHITISNPALTLGNTYTLYLNGEVNQSFTISNVVTTLGNSRTNQQPPSPGNNSNQSPTPR